MLTVLEPKKPGYEAVWNYGDWRLAMTQDAPHTHRDGITQLSRHMQTDEVFVLLSGEVTLLIGREMTEYPMEPGKIYNVKAGTWHQLQMSEDGKVLIVENLDTSRANSEYLDI